MASDHTTAFAIADSLYRTNPGNAVALNDRAMASYHSKPDQFHRDSVTRYRLYEDLNHAYSICHGGGYALRNILLIASFAGDHELVLHTFERIRHRHPLPARHWASVAHSTMIVDDAYRAIAMLRPVLDTTTACGECYVTRGIAYTQTKLYDLAARDFRAALALDSTDTDALRELGRVYYKLGDHATALSMYMDVLSLNPDHVITKSLIGNIYITTNQPDCACEWYEAAVITQEEKGITLLDEDDDTMRQRLLKWCR